MNNIEKVNILEKENKELKSEIEYLNKLLELRSSNEISKMLDLLNTLKKEKEAEISECKKYKEKYIKLCSELNELKNKYKKEMKRFLKNIKRL